MKQKEKETMSYALVNPAEKRLRLWRAAFFGVLIFLGIFFLLTILLIRSGYIPPGF